MKSNIVHRYFKKEEDGVKIILQINPIHQRGVELTIKENNVTDEREIEFGENIIEELKEHGYSESSALEFNLYHAGLAG